MFEAIALMMCAIAVAMVIYPLSKKAEVAERSDEEIFLRGQMDDIDARIDAATGDTSVLQEERAEIGRRLLRAVNKGDSRVEPKPVGRGGLTVVSVLSILIIPVASAAIYFTQGAPGTPDAPLSARLGAGELGELPIEQLVARAEDQLKTNPDDLRGWKVLERVYARMGRRSDQQNALVQIIRLDGETADRLALLAELRASEIDNIITTQGKELLLRARALEPDNIRANFMLAIAAEQEGDFPAAIAGFESLLARAEKGSALEPVLTERIARLRQQANLPAAPGMPKLDAETVEQTAQMPQADRSQFIRSMVDRLAARLDEAPQDGDGWQRLINAQLVLKDFDAASASLDRARKLFSNDTELLTKLNVLDTRLKTERAENQ
ncbi:c-type cytochrome biogenesis protein CcmI [Pseudahrensia aquimaris]|uniref:C-type cytochrome biogenesis protein CcmI n=1 Tax=Pseudahrensia aquimaris TaxID=744461 RepID=A0ABW3FHJ8_9HYPH